MTLAQRRGPAALRLYVPDSLGTDRRPVPKSNVIEPNQTE